ncbi:MAG: HipA domain-containing protein [Desulfovibrionaceae bacterium]|nr:HipA domain-containing protein [Desulfovibrionaceae bacterium]
MIKESIFNLFVFLQNKLIGTLCKKNGNVCFRYNKNAKRNISLSLPREDQETSSFQMKADFFFDNLLPEGNARKHIHALYGINGDSYFEILRIIGREVAGALIFSPDGELPAEDGLYRDVTREVQKYVQNKDKSICIQQAVPSRISLAGMQDKLAVLYKDKKMFVPVDYSPTTHIIKPDIPEFPGTVRNELLCLSVAEKLGFPVCGHNLLSVEGRDILLLDRYDRVCTGGVISRLHQEDFCQAMGIPSYYKYQSFGYDIYSEMGIVALVEVAKRANIDISKELAERCTLFYFFGNFDAHAKNYSLLYLDDALRLAPIYDVLCIPAVGPFDSVLAMEIGGIYTADKISADSFFSLGYDLDYPNLDAYARNLAESVPDAVRDCARDHAALYGNNPVYEKIINECSRLSENFKKISARQTDNDKTKKVYCDMCIQNPLNLEKVPLHEQTEKLIRIACENCKNIPGVSPVGLLQYIRGDLQFIVGEYQGFWGLDSSTGHYQWFDR